MTDPFNTDSERLRQQAERGHFMVLTFMRASGVILMLIGIYFMVAPLAGWPGWIGQLIFVIGVMESLVIPTFLARNWRTPSDPR